MPLLRLAKTVGALDPWIVLAPVTSMMPAVAVVMPVPLLMVPPVMLVPDSVSVCVASTCSSDRRW